MRLEYTNNNSNNWLLSIDMSIVKNKKQFNSVLRKTKKTKKNA